MNLALNSNFKAASMLRRSTYTTFLNSFTLILKVKRKLNDKTFIMQALQTLSGVKFKFLFQMTQFSVSGSSMWI